MKSTFDVEGFAALVDLRSDDWRKLYQKLEGEQRAFLSQERKFRSAEYRWPRDPLHTWSRLWEYPYVLHHLQRIIQSNRKNEPLTAVDIGSGVTFFPFSLARLGYSVTCVDIDPVCERDISAAAKVVDHTPGKVVVGLIDAERFPLADGSQDVAYCISVIEHIPAFANTIDEIARILKPGGKFILTVDIDLRGDSELGVDAFELMKKKISEKFKTIVPVRTVHPVGMLTSENSPYPLTHKSSFAQAKQLVKHAINARLMEGKASLVLYLTVYATVLEKV